MHRVERDGRFSDRMMTIRYRPAILKQSIAIASSDPIAAPRNMYEAYLADAGYIRFLAQGMSLAMFFFRFSFFLFFQ